MPDNYETGGTAGDNLPAPQSSERTQALAVGRGQALSLEENTVTQRLSRARRHRG